MLNTKLNQRTLTNTKVIANLPALYLIAEQNDLKLNTPRGFRIARAVLNRSINQN